MPEQPRSDEQARGGRGAARARPRPREVMARAHHSKEGTCPGDHSNRMALVAAAGLRWRWRCGHAASGRASRRSRPATAGSGSAVAELMKRARPQRGRRDRGAQDLHADRQEGRLLPLLVGRPVGAGDRDRHPEHAHPQVHRRLHARALAGLGLRRPGLGGRARAAATAAAWTCAGATPTTRTSRRRTATTTASSCSSATRPTRGMAVINLTRLHHHADRREPDPRVGPRRGVRHPEHRVRDRELAVSRRRSAAPTRRSSSTTRSTAARSRSGSSTAPSGPHRARAVVRDRAAALHAGPRRRRQARAATAGPSSTRSTPSARTAATWRASPPLESGASQNDMDYLHVINWKKAEELFKAGKTARRSPASR